MERGNNAMQPRINFGGNGKANTASAAVIVIIFVISTCIPILLTVFSNVKVTSEEVTVNSKYDLDSTIDLVKMLADDNLKVRKYYAEKGNMTLDAIAEVTSLEKEDLTNAWCSWIESYNTEANAVLCTITAHSDLGDADAAITSLDDLSISIDNSYYDDVNYDTLISIHDTLNNLYYLSRNSYNTYSDYESKYNTLNDDLNTYINNIE
jgi:cell division protein FtsX